MTSPRIIPRPSIVRLVVMAFASVLLLSSCYGDTEPTQALGALNWDRSANRVPIADPHGMLQYKAQAWADQLARENGLRHSRLTDGISGCWRGLAENVGSGAGIHEIEAAYMGSPAHRLNILNRNYNYAAVGVAHRGDRVFTVQVFMQSC